MRNRRDNTVTDESTTNPAEGTEVLNAGDVEATEGTPADSDTTIPAADGTATTPTEDKPKRGFEPDRGDIGTVAVEDDNDEWGAATRTPVSNNPVALSVASAEVGKGRVVWVENDPKKIERVKRMLRAAKTRRATTDGVKYEMNIHPNYKIDEDGHAGQVGVRYRLLTQVVAAHGEAPAEVDGPNPTE